MLPYVLSFLLVVATASAMPAGNFNVFTTSLNGICCYNNVCNDCKGGQLNLVQLTPEQRQQLDREMSQIGASVNNGLSRLSQNLSNLFQGLNTGLSNMFGNLRNLGPNIAQSVRSSLGS